jgi:hypothetical protein
MAYSPSYRHKKLTESGLVISGKCVIGAVLIGMDGTNDQEITGYDNTAESGDEVLPTTTYDASALGLNGYTGPPVECENGFYLGISGAGTREVVVFYKEYDNWGVF